MGTRQSFICFNDGGQLRLIDVATLPKRENKAPAVHTDAIPFTWHPTTGRYFDSKSQFRAETKRTGGLEVGNDLLTHKFSKPERKTLSAREHLEKNYNLHKNGELKVIEAETVSSFEKDHGAVVVRE